MNSGVERLGDLDLAALEVQAAEQVDVAARVPDVGFSIVSTFVALLHVILLQLEQVSCVPEPVFMFVSRALSFGVALAMSIG